MIHADPRQVVEELFKRERDMPLAPDGYSPVPNAPKKEEE